MLTREHRLPTYFGISVVFRIVCVLYITWQSTENRRVLYSVAHVWQTVAAGTSAVATRQPSGRASGRATTVALLRPTCLKDAGL